MAPSRSVVLAFAGLYVLSGICQPLLMTICKGAGLADPTAQLYMFFYYLGPAMLVVNVIQDYRQQAQYRLPSSTETSSSSLTATISTPAIVKPILPTKRAIIKACLIALFDIASQGLNYTGAGMAGSTIFAVIYSSVTVWTALWSRILLGRRLSYIQWGAIWTVFAGLALTALDSTTLGPAVKQGAIFISLGSAMHGASYVLSEAIMDPNGSDQLTIPQNASIQSLVALCLISIWQIFYTLPRWTELIQESLEQAGTTPVIAIVILTSFAIANYVHSIAFYHTLKFYPGGSTSAGVMKGLQAVLVFLATHVLFCGRMGGKEMCFTSRKFFSLITVITGVAIFGASTNPISGDTITSTSTTDWMGKTLNRTDYTPIKDSIILSTDMDDGNDKC